MLITLTASSFSFCCSLKGVYNLWSHQKQVVPKMHQSPFLTHIASTTTTVWNKQKHTNHLSICVFSHSSRISVPTVSENVFYSVRFSSVAQLCTTLCPPHGLQHARLPCPSPTSRAYSNSCPLNWWCHPTMSSSVVPFSPRLYSFPASESFQMSQFFYHPQRKMNVFSSTLESLYSSGEDIQLNVKSYVIIKM